MNLEQEIKKAKEDLMGRMSELGQKKITVWHRHNAHGAINSEPCDDYKEKVNLSEFFALTAEEIIDKIAFCPQNADKLLKEAIAEKAIVEHTDIYDEWLEWEEPYDLKIMRDILFEAIACSLPKGGSGPTFELFKNPGSCIEDKWLKLIKLAKSLRVDPLPLLQERYPTFEFSYEQKYFIPLEPSYVGKIGDIYFYPKWDGAEKIEK